MSAIPPIPTYAEVSFSRINPKTKETTYRFNPIWLDWFLNLSQATANASTAAADAVPSTRRINTTAPLAGGGDLTADLTLSIGASPFAIVNTAATDGGAAAATTVATAATSLTTGNNIAVFIRWENADTTTTISDTAGNTYTALTKMSAAGPVYGLWFYCLNATGNAANVVTCTFGAARPYRVILTVQFSSTSAASFDVETTATAAANSYVNTSTFQVAALGLVLVGRMSYNTQTYSSFDGGLTSFPYYSNFSWAAYLMTFAIKINWTITEIGSSATGRGIAVACFKV